MLKNKKMLSLIAALVSAASLLAGCGDGSAGVGKDAKPITYADESNGVYYPMQCENVLTVWWPGGIEDMGNSPLGKEWQKQLGVELAFEQPLAGNEAYTTMTAAGELPDILMTDLKKVPGGVTKQAEDGIIIALDDYMKYAPNLVKFLEENPDIDREIKSDDGHYYFFPFVRGVEELCSSQGPALRKDMLDKAGLAVPETVDEWTTVLREFKKQGAIAPLSFALSGELTNGFFTGAYDVAGTYYVQDGKVKYGFMEDGMKDALGTFNAWYKEGLLDRNIVAVPDMDGQWIQGQTAAGVLWAGGGIGKYLNAKAGSSFDLVAAPPMVLEKGDVSNFGGKTSRYVGSNNAYITADCENIELAMRILDFGYSEAGHLMWNFGIEGESYTMVDGIPTYTDIILKPANGMAISEAMMPYVRASASGPFIQSIHYQNQYYQLEQQKEAPAIWGKCNSDKTKIPNITFTTEESNKLAQITTNIQTCSEEYFIKFVTGEISFDKYDDFKARLVEYGVEDAIEIYQAAYDRYMKR